MGSALKHYGDFWGDVVGSAADPFGTVTGKNALERSGLFNMPKGESIAGESIMGPTKAWKPKDAAGIALSQPKAAKGPKQYLGNVSGSGFLGTK